VNEIIFTERVFDTLRTSLLASKFESSAILIAHPVLRQSSTRLLVREVHHVPTGDYRKRNTSRAIVDPVFIAPLAKEAIRVNHSLVFVHTHPFDTEVPLFSDIDDEGEALLREFLDRRGSKTPHAALVFSKRGCRARLLERNDPCTVLALGHKRRVEFESSQAANLSSYVDRQVRLLGYAGQRKLESIRAAIIGLGGTGSIIGEFLAHLGVQRFVLIDPDRVDITNLNRLVGARPPDIGKPKVDVARALLLSINPNAQIDAVCGDVLDASISKRVTEADFFFCCTDSQASRALLNQLAYQYLIPGINVGVAVASRDRQIAHIVGRVQLLAPQNACLTCQELLDPKTVRLEFLTEQERKQDPYFLGEGEPQPAVISFNGTTSSLAITMFLAVVADLPSEPRNLVYNAIEGRVRPTVASIMPTCVVCSPRGALARGDDWPLPVRNRNA